MANELKNTPHNAKPTPTDPGTAYSYAIYVIKGRWVEAEPIIMRKPGTAYWYANHGCSNEEVRRLNGSTAVSAK